MTQESPLHYILLVEDNLADICLLRLALKEAGLNFDLTVLHDGAEALSFVSRQGKYHQAPCPDLAILDLTLPKHDAVEILQAIRSSEHMRHVPAVILTSLASPDKAASIRALGVAAQIDKPSNLHEFLRIGHTLKDILQQTRRTASMSAP